MSDQTDQQNEDDTDFQSGLSSVSKTATENSSEPNQQESATPAAEIGVDSAAESTEVPVKKHKTSSLKSLIKVKPAPDPPAAEKDEALARAMAKMNEAKLDPIDPLDAPSDSLSASISPVISTPNFTTVAKPSASPSAKLTFSSIPAKAGSEAQITEESSNESTTLVPEISTVTSEVAPVVAQALSTPADSLPPVHDMSTATDDAPTVGAETSTNSNETPDLTGLGTSSGQASVLNALGINTGDSPRFSAAATNTADVLPFTAGTTTGGAPPSGTNTLHTPPFTSVGTQTDDAPMVETNTGERPAFTAVETNTVDQSDVGISTTDIPIFTSVGTNTGEPPAFVPIGTSSTDAPPVSSFETNTGEPPVSQVGTDSSDAPPVGSFGTNTGEPPVFVPVGTSSAVAPPVSSFGTNTGEPPVFAPVGISSTDAQPISSFGTNTGEAPALAGDGTDSSDVPTFTVVGTSTGKAPASIPVGTNNSLEVPTFNPTGISTGEAPRLVANVLPSVPVETQSSSSLPKVIPDAIPESEFELPEPAEFELPADSEFEVPDKPDKQPRGSITVDASESAAPAITQPPEGVTPPKPALLPSSTSQAPLVVPRTNAIGLIIEDDSPAVSDAELRSLNPNMSSLSGSKPSSPVPLQSTSPIDDDSEWGEGGDLQSTAEADNYTSGSHKYPLVGQVLFDSYAILDGIGEGATCKVYSAMKLDSDRLVAIKTPKTQIGLGFKHRFAEAAMKHGKLKHPNIVKSIAYLESPEGQPFFVMEHLAGVTLEEILQTVERVDDEETLALVLCQIATALEYAHGLGICHAVLTPRDVLVIESDEQLTVKVMDFQIAEVSEAPKTSKDKKPSSKIFLSPEALRGEEPSPLSDIYSLGVIAYRMCTGRYPFDGTIDSERDSEKVADPLAKYNPDMKRVHQLNEVVQMALEAEPEWRVESAANFRAGILEWIETVRTEATGVYSSVELDETQINGAPDAISFELPDITVDPALQAVPAEPGSAPASDSVAQAKYKRKKVRHVVKTTIHNLVALKQKQQKGEEAAGRKFADTVAAKGPRRSPISSMLRLISTIAVCSTLFIGAGIFLLTNFENVKVGFGNASRALSELLPGRKKQEFEIGEKIVFEKPKPVPNGPKPKPKIRSTDIHATPPPFAIPESERLKRGTFNLGAGVNNSSGSNRNRRRIEYRDYVAPGPNN